MTTMPGGEAAAEPEPDQTDEEQQRARRVAGDVGRPVVGGGVAGSGRRTPASIARDVVDLRGRSAGTRRRCPRIRAEPVAARRRARARAARPAPRRTTPAAGAARTAARPGRRARQPASPAERPGAGSVPAPTLRLPPACSGGNALTCDVPAGRAPGTSQSRRATSTTRDATTSRPRPGRPGRPRRRAVVDMSPSLGGATGARRPAATVSAS